MARTVFGVNLFSSKESEVFGFGRMKYTLCVLLTLGFDEWKVILSQNAFVGHWRLLSILCVSFEG